MYSNNFYPDSLTEQDIEALLDESYDTVEDLLTEAFDIIGETVDVELTECLLDGPAVHRWARRTERQAVNGTVRMLPVRRVALVTDPDGEEAA